LVGGLFAVAVGKGDREEARGREFGRREQRKEG
jgi:hypothetical protein